MKLPLSFAPWLCGATPALASGLPRRGLARIVRPTRSRPRSAGTLGLLLAALFAAAPARAAFELAGPGGVATVFVAAGEPECVRLAAADLAGDVRKITGRALAVTDRRPANSTGKIVILASLNRPDSAAAVEKLAPGFGAALMGKWEAYRVETVGDQLLVVGSDERGTMFGLYAFIETYLGVDPLYFWASRQPAPRATLAWDEVKLSSGEPSFKFRGWFINDEDLLTEWKDSGGKRNINYPFYSQVVPREVIRSVAEALVRSRCNLIIPASFLDIMNPPEEALVQECARRGVFVSQHHVEPLGVSAFAYFNYWKARGRDLKYSYFSHRAEVLEVWTAYAKKWAAYPNVIWQLGLRGIADRPMWMADPNTPQSDADRGRLISDAMAEQVKILHQVAPGRTPILSTTLWAEGSVLNQQKLLTIPEGTIIVFADNSPGWKWQQDFYTTPRNPKNSYGVYYHHALWGSGPHLAQVPSPQRTFECLRTAVEHGAGTYAICNVSNVREFVLGIDATAKMTWRMPGFDPEAWLASWVRERFSAQRDEITNAYREYFNTWQIHDERQVPFLMDGQMISAGNSSLNQMAKKLAERAGAAGPTTKKASPALKAGAAAPAETRKAGDAFWSAIGDMHPASSRGEIIKRVAVQKAGFTRVAARAQAVAAALPESEAALLRDNLVFQSAIARQMSTWLEQVELAHEALDQDNRQACREAMVQAESAFAEISKLAEPYTRGQWENWYRGTKKINLTTTLQRTRDVLRRTEGAR